MAMGLFGLALRWLSPLQAALCAVAAISHNLWLFPHYGMRRLERPEEKARGYSGMIGYPVVVLVLILLCWRSGYASRGGLAVAAGAWAILAFGDAAAALFGMGFRGPVLPWNAGKRWSGWLGFTLVGGTFAWAWQCFVGRAPFLGPDFPRLLAASFLAAFVAGLVETLPGQMDDNLTVPLVAWVVLTFFDAQGWAYLAGRMDEWRIGRSFDLLHMAPDMILLMVNFGLGLDALKMDWVSKTPALIGILFGAIVIVGAGWQGYLFLVLFYFIAQFSTYFGKRIKEQRGIAEPNEGRREMGSVFSKGLVPAFFSLVSPLAMVAALAVYASDTVASEVGKASRGKAYLLPRFKRVPQGTVGAVSLAGTAAGLAVILFFVALASVLGLTACRTFFLADVGRIFAGQGMLAQTSSYEVAAIALCLTISCGLSFFLESVLNEKAVARGIVSKEVGHLITGALAGSLCFGVAHFIHLVIKLLGVMP